MNKKGILYFIFSLIFSLSFVFPYHVEAKDFTSAFDITSLELSGVHTYTDNGINTTIDYNRDNLQYFIFKDVDYYSIDFKWVHYNYLIGFVTDSSIRTNGYDPGYNYYINDGNLPYVDSSYLGGYKYIKYNYLKTQYSIDINNSNVALFTSSTARYRRPFLLFGISDTSISMPILYWNTSNNWLRFKDVVYSTFNIYTGGSSVDDISNYSLYYDANPTIDMVYEYIANNKVKVSFQNVDNSNVITYCNDNLGYCDKSDTSSFVIDNIGYDSNYTFIVYDSDRTEVFNRTYNFNSNVDTNNPYIDLYVVNNNQIKGSFKNVNNSYVCKYTLDHINYNYLNCSSDVDLIFNDNVYVSFYISDDVSDYAVKNINIVADKLLPYISVSSKYDGFLQQEVKISIGNYLSSDNYSIYYKDDAFSDNWIKLPYQQYNYLYYDSTKTLNIKIVDNVTGLVITTYNTTIVYKTNQDSTSYYVENVSNEYINLHGKLSRFLGSINYVLDRCTDFYNALPYKVQDVLYISFLLMIVVIIMSIIF